jgi:hypothetical protein
MATNLTSMRIDAKKPGWAEADSKISLHCPHAHELFGTDALQSRLADITLRQCQPFASFGRTILNG